MVSFAQRLAPLIARPPTPPKDNTTKLSSDTLNGFDIIAANRPLVDTPDDSPSSSAEYFKTSSGKLQKKVGFSPWTKFHRPLNTSGKDSDSDGHIRRLPPSKDCKSSKSILKPSTDNGTVLSGTELLAFDHTSLPAMLRSTTQHLASTSRASRLDAYSTLLACLSAYEEVPEGKELVEKVVEITGYIRRDVSAKIDEDGGLDIQLATQALKLLTVFLCTPTMAVMLPEDFCSFILERSISSIEDERLPKILVSHYMHLIEKQKFSAKVVTTDRANRLLSALDGVTTRIKGNRVVGHRLMIYQRLLTQAKTTMTSRVGSWIDHLVAGMLSTIKDIRARAIAFGTEASLHLGTTSSVSQAFIELFNRVSPEGKKVVNYLSSRLIDMTSSKEDGVHVPQIWSVVILFLRSRRRQLECWEHLKAWLVIIQRCFNASDAQIKFQANLAWNRLIFAINLDISTSSSMAKMLRQPIVAQLERRSSDKNAKSAKQIARSSYCALLYHAFRPSATHAQLDQYWDLYVSQILPSCFSASKDEVNLACDILAALFSNTKPAIWDENRANLNGPVKPDELPCLDPKWIRLRTASILQTFDKLFDLTDWYLGKGQEFSILVAWRHFVTALGIASSKEVKVSMETMNAVAHIINEIKSFLERSEPKLLKESSPHQQEAASDMSDDPCIFKNVKFLIQEAVAKIGAIPFLERRVLLTSQDSFEAAETPSRRSSRDQRTLSSPATHLLNLLLTNLPKASITACHTEAIKFVMHIPLQSLSSRRVQLGVLRNLSRMLSVDSTFHLQARVVFWQLLADATASALRLPQQNESHNASPQYPGHEYREAVKILELGIQQGSFQIVPAWLELHNCIVDTLREEIGAEAIILMVTEPLAGLICKEKQWGYPTLQIAHSILDKAHWPQSQQSTERSQKRLWGVVQVSHKSTSLDPYDHIYSMIDALLNNTYISLECLPSEEANTVLFPSVTLLIQSCPPSLNVALITRIQGGLGLWIEDANGCLSDSRSKPHGLYAEVRRLWEIVVAIIRSALDFNTRFLFSIQNLLTSGMRSQHKAIVNDSISMWNSTFGCAGSLEYPEELRKILVKLKSMTDLQLPTFPAADCDEVMSSPIRFVESQDGEEDLQQRPIATTHQQSPSERPSPQATKLSTLIALSPSPRTAAVVQCSPHSARRDFKITPKARLRHDDSQIKFAAVESSPLVSEPVDSQYLTDRQKEVKERQEREAAVMFPEIRSSPRSACRPTEYNLPKLVFKPNTNPSPGPTVDDEISPSFPPDVLMNDFLGSSPTPSSCKKRAIDDRSDDGPPSSPPTVSSHLEIKIHQDTRAAQDNDVHVQDAGQDQNSNVITGEDLPAAKNISSENNDEQLITEGQTGAVPQELALAPQVPPSHNNANLHSDDVFVDAPTEPQEDQTAIGNFDSDTSRVMNSFQSEGSSHFSTEEDQITAQLVSEMERASSQQMNRPEQSTEPATKTNKKRKANFEARSDGKKRAKSTASSPDPQMVFETPRPSETVADCVMIYVREAMPEFSARSPSVKKERPPSLSLVSITPAAGETPAIEKRSIGRSRGSRASQSSSQGASSVRRSARQDRVKQEPCVDMEHSTALLPKSARRSANFRGESLHNPLTGITSPKDNTTVEPGSGFAFGRAPEEGSFGRRQQPRNEDSSDHESRSDLNAIRSSQDSTAELVTEHMKDSKMQNIQRGHAPPKDSPTQGQTPRNTIDQAPTASYASSESGTEAENPLQTQGERPTAQAIIQGFRNMLDNIKRVALGPEEERAVVGILFESVKEAHDAGRRHPAM